MFHDGCVGLELIVIHLPDIPGVTYVVNYDLPQSVDEYVHRIGRTGRVGNAGKALSFYDPEGDSTIAKNLVKILSEVRLKYL